MDETCLHCGQDTVAPKRMVYPKTYFGFKYGGFAHVKCWREHAAGLRAALSTKGTGGVHAHFVEIKKPSILQKLRGLIKI